MKPMALIFTLQLQEKNFDKRPMEAARDFCILVFFFSFLFFFFFSFFF
jgi:hypothetical protein